MKPIDVFEVRKPAQDVGNEFRLPDHLSPASLPPVAGARAPSCRGPSGAP